MMYFYASVDTDNWEEDTLGDSVLPAGNAVVMIIDDGSGYCLYDFRAVFADDTEAMQAAVNVCEARSRPSPSTNEAVARNPGFRASLFIAVRW